MNGDEDSFDVFSLYGIGMLYSQNTIQNLIDFYMRMYYDESENKFDFINKSIKIRQKNNDDFDVLYQLDFARKYLFKRLSQFIKIKRIVKCKFIKNDISNLNLSANIANDFIFPSLMLMVYKQNDIKNILLSMKKHFKKGEWDGKDDIPVISNKFISFLKLVFEKDNLGEENMLEIIEIWIDFFNSRGVIDDLLILVCSCVSKNYSPKINVEYVINEINKYVEKPVLANVIERIQSIPFFVGKLIKVKNESPILRKSTAFDGFLYVYEPNDGLLKIGTGQNGTVFTSIDIVNNEYLNVDIKCITICNNKLLLLNETNIIEVINTETLKRIGYILDNGQFSIELKQTNKVIPKIKYLGFYNQLFFIDGLKVYLYEMQNDISLKFIKEINLNTFKQLNYKSTLLNSSNIPSIITNGYTISLFYQKNPFKKNIVMYEFALEDGCLISKKKLTNFYSSCVCYDPISNILFDLPNYETPNIYILPQNFHFLNLLSYHSTDNSLLNILDTIPYLFASRLSNYSSNYEKFEILSMNYIYETISFLIEKSQYCYLSSLIKIISLYLLKYQNCELPKKELICKIFQLNEIKDNDKILLIFSLFKYNADPVQEFEDIVFILNFIDPYLFIEATKKYEYFQYPLLISIFHQEKIIERAVEHINISSSYAFIQNIIKSTSFYVFNEKSLDSSIILILFKKIVPIKSHFFFSIMASMMPLLQKSLSQPLSFCSTINTINFYLKKMYTMIPQNALSDYAKFHLSISSEQPFYTQDIIDESQHPYPNNCDYVHHYDFPTAIKIIVKFDPRTASETNCDYLQIFSDAECKQKITGKLSGKYNRWKAEPIITSSKHLSFKFHSDGTINDWGYKAIISATIFSKTNYTTPDFSFDIYRSLYNIVLKIMENSEIKSFFKIFNLLKFGDYKPFSPKSLNSLPNEILQKISNKFNLSYDDACNELIKLINEKFESNINLKYKLNQNQLMIINHLLTISEHCNLSNDVLSVITSPTLFLDFPYKNIHEHYSNLTNSLLFYVPQGNYSSKLSFLYNSFNEANVTEKFINDSFNAINSIFKSENPSIILISDAAIKASFTMQLFEKKNYNDYISFWFDCLKTLSTIRIDPIITLDSNIYKTILNWGCLFQNNSNDFIRNHIEILKKTKINKSSYDLPVVSIIVKRIFMLEKNNYISNDLMEDLVKVVLMFNIPYVLITLKKLIEKFNVKLTNLHGCEEILCKIGKKFRKKENIPKGKVKFNCGISFSYSLAECFFKLLSTEILDSFSNFIVNQDSDVKIGALIILSQNNYILSPGNEIYLPKLNKRAIIKSMDPLKYILQINDNTEIVIPSFDYSSLSLFKYSFKKIHSKHLIPTDSLIKNVVNLLNGKYDLFAIFALNKLLFQSISFDPIEILNKIKITKSNTRKENQENNKKYFVSNQSTNVYQFNIEDTPITFGFCGNDDSQNVLFSYDGKYINFNCSKLFEFEKLHQITIGYLENGMRIYFFINQHIIFTNVFMPPMLGIKPVILTDKYISLFDPFPLIDFPYFNSNLSVIASQPTHIFSPYSIIPINNILKPISCKYSKSFSIDLFPEVSSKLPFYYIELSFNANLECISLFCTSHRLFSFYDFELKNIKPKDTFGILIKNRCIGLVINSKLIYESLKKLPKYDWIISISLNSLESIFANLGQYPFMFDPSSFDDLISNIQIPSSKPIKKECNFISTLQKSSLNNYMNLSFSKNNNTNINNEKLYRPYLIKSNEKGNFYFGKVGIGTFNENNNSNIDLDIFNDDTFTLTQQSFQIQNTISILDSINHDNFNSIYSTFAQKIPIDFCYELSPFDETQTYFYSSERKINFFNSIELIQRYEIMNMCMIKIIEKYGIDRAINDFDLKQFIINSITIAPVNDFEPFEELSSISYKQILYYIFKYNNSLFEELCNNSLLPFSIKKSNFKSNSRYTLCNSNSNSSNIITFNHADAILFIPIDFRLLENPHRIKNQCNELNIISPNLKKYIYLFRGDTIEIDAFSEKEIALAVILPMCFQSPKFDYINFRFSLQFISQAIQYTKENPEFLKKTSKHILIPLLNLFIEGKRRIVPDIQCKWFSIIFNEAYEQNLLNLFQNNFNLSIFSNYQPNLLTLMIYISKLYLQGVNMEEYELEILQNIKFILFNQPKYAPQIFKQLSSNSILPFKKIQEILTNKIPYKSITKSMEYQALQLSQTQEKNKIIISNEKDELPFNCSYKFEGANKIAIIKILQNNILTIKVNKSILKKNSIIDGNKITISILNPSKENEEFFIVIVPLYHVKDQNDKINSYEYKINSKIESILEKYWTQEYEIVSQLIVKNLVLTEKIFLFSIYPDELFRIIFPNIDPNVARYRLSTIFLTLSKLDDSQIVSNESNIFHNFFIDFKSTHDTKANTNDIIIEYNLFKKAKFSDFFYKFNRFLENIPIPSLQKINYLIQLSGNEELIKIEQLLNTLINDMFSNGIPCKENLSDLELQAYQGFGTFITSLIISDNSIPIYLDKSVIRYAFGEKIEISPELQLQYDSIRLGAFKLEIISPSLFKYFGTIQSEIVQMLPLQPITTQKSLTNFQSFLLSDPILHSYIRYLIFKHKINTCYKDFQIIEIDKFSIYLKQNTIYIPKFSTWKNCFKNYLLRK